MKIRIATRKSALALWQAKHVADALRPLPQVTSVELVPLTTRGDEVLDRSLQKIGGKGLFMKELEVAMEAGDADIAVHSMKDVPANMPERFCIAAVLERANPADALVGKNLGELAQGARVGSSSLRRQAQLLALRPDIRVEPLRGSINTRLQKLEDGQYDAIILACAGLERLGLEAHISEIFSPDQMLPAAAQGIIGIECLEDRTELLQLLKLLDHAATRTVITAERVVAKQLQADCQSPVATFGEIDGTTLNLRAMVASPDGRKIIREQVSGPADDPEALGISLSGKLLDMGAAALLAQTGTDE
ncbi:MAG: hydroxymethylbilane synthase [Gammaproteobacteria bacterium]|nr:MAG: hydroxymethylbilane synthase [Gammaproteobacteria bacterium]